MDRLLIGDSCEILVGAGLLGEPVLPSRPDRTAAAVLSQPGAAMWTERVADGLRDLGLRVPIMQLPDGEQAKSLATVESAYRWLAAAGVNRSDTVVAVGGGTVTDVAGFVAATYLRGIEAVYVPTTLLGAVDAAIGGKTGVNLRGKNLVGVFRHPTRVVIDTELLADLPDNLWREGAAEALKAGLIADGDLVSIFERSGRLAPTDEIVRRAVAVKVAVVADDFTEQGRRAVLNYGHTVGHAVEIAAGVSHGEAVAVGMVAAGVVAQMCVGFAEADRQRAIIGSLGLPTGLSNLDRAAVRALMESDKKRDAAGIRMVLLRAIGDPVVQHVDDIAIDHAIAAVSD